MLLLLFVGCLTSQQQATVSQGRICSDKFTCCHTEIEVADPTFYLTQSQHTERARWDREGKNECCLCVCVCVCVYIYTYMHTHTSTHTHINTNTHTHILIYSIHTYMAVCMCVCLYLCVHTCVYMRVCVHLCVCVCSWMTLLCLTYFAGGIFGLFDGRMTPFLEKREEQECQIKMWTEGEEDPLWGWSILSRHTLQHTAHKYCA